MITALIKRIWCQRRANGWIFAELFLVFIILWYVIDFLISSFICTSEPKGYDTHHVYHVSISVNPKMAGNEDGWEDNYLYALKLIKEYPGVESVCYYSGTVAYEEGGKIVQSYTVDSTRAITAYIRYVSKDFFDVFRVDVPNVDLSHWDVASYPVPAVVSKDLADSIFMETPRLGQVFADYYVPEKKYTVAGVAAPTKLTEYDRYSPLIYVPVEKWMLSLPYWVPIVAIRVSPEVEEGFADRFMKDMRRRLDIGALYLSQIRSNDEVKAIYDTQINNYIRSAYAIISFFVFNVFLSIMGTFWFRTRRRRSEIGLRMAMGASKKSIGSELCGEGICLLVLAVIPALIVCFNMYWADLTINMLSDATPARFLSGIAITFSLLAAMILISIWYPAYQAMKIEPAETLHEE